MVQDSNRPAGEVHIHISTIPTMNKHEAFKEVMTHEPKVVMKSGKTGNEKRKMMLAIALSKANLSRKKKRQ